MLYAEPDRVGVTQMPREAMASIISSGSSCGTFTRCSMPSTPPSHKAAVRRRLVLLIAGPDRLCVSGLTAWPSS